MQADNIHNSGRIAKNTLVLYIRMIFLMFISIYTSRIVLNALGVEDYGIYNVVGGVVSMFTILSGSMSAAISRFITFELGRSSDLERLRTVFSTSVTVQVIIAVLVVLLAEGVGVWFINNRMNIDPERLNAANWVFQLSLLSFAVNLLSIPYNASIIAHEKMSAFAYISIFEGVAKLSVAFLTASSPFDRLIFYAMLTCVVAVIVRILYSVYCRKYFDEVRFHFCFDKGLFREMFSFAGWNFIGVTSGALRDHGGNILINIFSGPAANAARAVSVQLGGAIQSFVTNFMTAVNPQITKSYAAEEREYTMELVFRSSRYAFYLLSLIAFPVLLNAGFILDLWLEDVPLRSESFVCLALILSMSECISNPLVTLMLATGNIRNYQLIVGGLQLLNLPVSYLVLKAGAPPESILLVAIVISQICLFARLFLLRGMTGLPVGRFIRQVYLRILFVAVLSYLPSWWLTSLSGEGIWAFAGSCLISLTLSALVIWTAGLSSDERRILKEKAGELIERRRRL